MNAETFFESFDLLAEAPSSVAKLRELILQLAVQGKLVPQDSSDEPASILLSKITKHKQRLAASGIGRKADPGAINTVGQLPKGWTATQLGDVIHLVSGQHLKPQEYNEQGEGHPYLTGPADFGPRHPTATRWTSEERALAVKNDILITVKGAGIGKTNVLATKTAFISRQLMAIRPIIADSEFIHICLQSAFDKFQDQGVGIAIPGIGREDILLHPILLPPLAEQRRIVAKVDELLGLCDELGTRQGARRELRERLVQAALDQLLASRDPADFATHWKRLQVHFDILFVTPEAVNPHFSPIETNRAAPADVTCIATYNYIPRMGRLCHDTV